MLIKEAGIGSTVLKLIGPLGILGGACWAGGNAFGEHLFSDPPAEKSLSNLNEALAKNSPEALAENMNPELKRAVYNSEKSIFGSLPAHLGYIGGGYYGLKQYLKHKAAKARRALGYVHY